MVYNFFDKRSNGSGVDTKPNYQLVNQLHRQIIGKFKRRKIYSSFTDNTWDVDLADLQSLSKYKKESSIYCVQLICLVNLHGKFV